MAEQILLTAGVVEITAAAGDKRTPRVSIVAYTGGVMRPPGWPELAIDLSGADVAGVIPILAGHGDDLDAIGGQGTALVRNHQLRLEGHLTLATPAGQKIKALADSGINLQASVGFAPTKREHIPAGATVRVNNRSLTAGPNGLTIIRAGRLREVSLLPLGADSETRVSISARKGNHTMADNATTTTTTDPPIPDDLKFPWDRDGLTASERILARWNGTTFHEPNIRQQTERFLHAALGGTLDYSGFERELLRAQVRDLELQRIHAERPKGPAIRASSRDLSGQVVEASICRAAGLANVEKHFQPEILEAADRGYRSFGLQELLLHAAGERGYTGRSRITITNLRDVLAHALPAIQASGFSTLDVSGILSNAANKFLADGFASTEQVWRAISRIRPVSDFKTSTVYRLTADLEYEEVGPGGEIKHGTLGEESYTISAKTYAKMLGLTRQDIINDDLGAFDGLRNRLGRGAGLKLNSIFWTAFLDNAAFFTAARANYNDGGDSTLTDAGTALDLANQLFQALTDADGGPLGITAKIILVPPALSAIARRLFVSAEMRDTTASTRYPVGNIFQNRFRPLESAYLSNASYPGYSAAAWYLLADPSDIPVMEVAFLNGVEAPTIEQADADFNTLGIQLRGYHDFGCAKAEWRAGVKSAGA